MPKSILFLLLLLTCVQTGMAQTGFVGGQLGLTVNNPFGSVIAGPYSITVGPAGSQFPNLASMELPGAQTVPVKINVTNNALAFDFSDTGLYFGFGTNPFNGYIFTASGGIPPISSVTIDPSTTLGLDSSRIAFNATQILVNLQGLTFNTSTKAKLNVSFTTTPLQFVPVTPCRILDTRNPAGTFGGPFLTAGASRSVPVQSSACGIPASAQAYALNLTVVPRASSLGFLTVWPAGQSQPLVSTLNSPDGSVLANAAIVPAGTGGAVNVFASDNTDLVIDINGYFTPPPASSLQFYPLTPCRVLDTRNPNGMFGGPFIAAGSSRDFPIPSSSCGVPASAKAYSFNVTVVPRGGLGYLTAWPAGQPQPLASTLNSQDGTVLANAAIVPAGAGGAVSFYASNPTDLVVDINGYFAPPGAGGLNFYAIAPCRVADTRNTNGSFGGPILAGSASRTFPVPQAACGLPLTASAYSLNMTVVPQGPLGFLTTWPTGQAQPVVSTLNAQKGIVIANAAIVPAGTSGGINVFPTSATHLVIDANGYFAP